MINSIKDILIVSDIDGTLVTRNKTISGNVIDAVNDFTAKGGHFTVCTGRVYEAAAHLIQGLNITDPSIHVNGGYLYDWYSGKLINPNYIPYNARYLCRKIIERFPFCDCHFANEHAVNLITSGECVGRYLTTEKVYRFDGGFDSVPDNIFKYIVTCEESKMEEVRKFAESICDRNIKVIQSSGYFLEILPKANSKSEALRLLCSLTGFDMENVVACGDYENDIDMLKTAGIGVAMDNALDDVKAAADITVPSCEEDGIADLISMLEEMYD